MKRAALKILGAGLLVAAHAAAGSGCSPAQRDERIVSLTREGQFGRALGRAKRLGGEAEAGDRSFLLSQMRVLPLALAEGVPDAARQESERVFDVLRTAGLNDDKTIGAFLFTQDGTQIWKGDPFEQALAFAYVAMIDATGGEWGNVRAASNNALFQLRDFSAALGSAGARPAGDGEREQVDQRLALIDRAIRRDPRGVSDAPDTLPVNYAAVLSDFELGYALKAVACRRLGEVEELAEAAGQLRAVAPRLDGLSRLIEGGAWNSVLVVSAGIGPEKYAGGPDRALALFRATTPSGDEPLVVSVNGGVGATFPVVTDVNRMARDLKWNNLEDLRKAKSTIGNALIGAGAIAIIADGNDDNRAATYAGLGAILAGLALKATAYADTRQCDAFPQRFYVAPLDLPEGRSTLEVAAGSRRLVVPVLREAGGATLFRYVRLPEQNQSGTGGRLLYTSDAAAADVEYGRAAALPWILGGRDVRTPSADVLRDCQRLGLLEGLQLQDLIDLYRAEEISVVGVDADAAGGRHILEGGTWLYTPLAGTAGFARLYTVEHGAYQPRSDRVRERAAIERAALRRLDGPEGSSTSVQTTAPGGAPGATFTGDQP